MTPEPTCTRAQALLALLLVAGMIIGCGGSDETTPAAPTPDEAPAVTTTTEQSPVSAPRLDSPAEGSTMDARPNFGGIVPARQGDSREVTIEIWSGEKASGRPIEEITTGRSDQGAFSARVGPSLDSGLYSARAKQVDAAGNLTRSEVRGFSVDAGMPPMILAAGDIGGCSTPGDEATATLLDLLPGTVAALGDIAYDHGTAAQFECYDAAWGRHKARVRPVLGDHDYDTDNAGPYFDYFGAAAGARDEGYYSYDLGDWHIVALNSNCHRLADGCGRGSSELRWLRDDLAANPAVCTLAYMANPVFSSGAIHGNQKSPLPLWRALFAAGTEIVLSADDHIYERFAPQQPDGTLDPEAGIREFVVGTGGRSLYDFGTIQPNSEARNNDAFGILELTLRPGSYSWRFVPEEGRSFSDSGAGECH